MHVRFCSSGGTTAPFLCGEASNCQLPAVARALMTRRAAGDSWSARRQHDPAGGGLAGCCSRGLPDLPTAQEAGLTVRGSGLVCVVSAQGDTRRDCPTPQQSAERYIGHTSSARTPRRSWNGDYAARAPQPEYLAGERNRKMDRPNQGRRHRFGLILIAASVAVQQERSENWNR